MDDIIDDHLGPDLLEIEDAPHKKGSQQLPFDTEWTQDRIEENKVINRIRQRVGLWCKEG